VAHSSDSASQLARSQLYASLRELEKEAEEGRYHTSCLRYFGGVCALLKQRDLVERALSLLHGAPDSAFLAEIVTNAELPKSVPERLRAIDDLATLEEQHPPFVEQRIKDRISSYAKAEEHFALCIQGKIQEARSTAPEGIRLEEIGLTLAFLGQFDEAFSIVRYDHLEAFRQRCVRLVLAVEFFRRGYTSECEELLNELEASGSDAWEHISLALAFSGREPWADYPYPDW
jgi:hypothetical protein